jgi:ABC-2 type transport system permease protein
VFLLLPLTFLSTAFMAPALMPHRMRIVADCNPVNWALEAGRAAMSATPDWARVFAQGGGLLALAVAVTALSVLTFRAYQKSVRPPTPADDQPTGAARSSPVG